MNLVLIGLGIVIIIVGFSIKRKGKTSFIAGNNEMFVLKNERKLADRIGFVVMLFGVETAFFPIIYKLIN